MQNFITHFNLHQYSTNEIIWLAIGLIGQTLFFMRFLIQWVVSEKNKRSVIPDVFWYFSLGGGLILLTYAIHRQDIVFTLGQSIGVFVYIRNIMLVRKTNATAA
jgi:lipid-A-disaccharide synthase-like uncharacterized protein